MLFMRFLFLLGSVLWAQMVYGQVEQLFEKGNIAFEQEQYEAAIGYYERIVQKGYYSSDLYFNLGNSYFKNGNVGKAVLFLERALSIAPDDQAVVRNLNFITEQVKENQFSYSALTVKSSVEKLLRAIYPSFWSIGAILWWSMGFAGVFFWLRGARKVYRKIGFYTALPAFFLAFIFVGLALVHHKLLNANDFGVIIEEEVALRSAPEKSGKTVKVIHEGWKVELLDSIGDWKFIRLVNGEDGWIQQEFMEPI